MICIAVQPMEMMRWERPSQMAFVVMATAINRCLMTNAVGLIRVIANSFDLGEVYSFDHDVNLEDAAVAALLLEGLAFVAPRRVRFNVNGVRANI